MASAEGVTLEDVDGNRYLDFAGWYWLPSTSVTARRA